MAGEPAPKPENVEMAARRCAEARRVLAGAWGNEDVGRRFALDLMSILPQHLTPAHLAFADVARTANREALLGADLYLADHDMVDLLDTAAPTMPDQELDLRDVLSPSGFLWFATPLPDRTGDEPHIALRALSWVRIDADSPVLADRATGRPHILLTAYVKTLDFADAALRAQGRMVDGAKVDLAPGAPGLTPNSTVMWEEASLIGEVFGEVPHVLSGAAFYQRVASAFWTLARQPLTETTHAPAGARQDRKRSARAGVVDPNKGVQVIRLRRSAPRADADANAGPGEQTGRKVGVRFVTRGFWRRQYLPSTGSHRQQYIAPHWRGPEGAPIKGGERVFLAEGAPRRQQIQDQKDTA